MLIRKFGAVILAAAILSNTFVGASFSESAQTEQFVMFDGITGEQRLIPAEDILISDAAADEYIFAESVFYSSDTDDYFERCNSDYGYNDMLLRNKGTYRQQAYRRLEEAAKEFYSSSVNLSAPVQDDGDGDPTNDLYLIKLVDLSDMDLTVYDVREIYFTFRKDNPLYYFSSTSVYYTVPNDVAVTGSTPVYGIAYCTEYDYINASDRAQYNSIIYDAINEYTAKTENMLYDYDKVLALNNAICEDIDYAYVNGVASNAPSAHNITGVFDERIDEAVCEGYAHALQILLNYSGIDNVFVAGTANGGGHAWNMVKLDSEYYYVDTTWNDTSRNNYFARGSIYFNTNHTPNTPDNAGEYFLYALPTASALDYAGPVAVTSVSLNKDTLNMLAIGQTEQLSAAVLPTNASVKDVIWSSDNPSVATVDENGIVTAVAEGTAVITAASKDGNKIADCTVTVKLPEIVLAGDVSDDGTVDNNDVALLFLYNSGWSVTVNEDAADVNGDGKINGKDSMLLFRYNAGWDSTLN